MTQETVETLIARFLDDGDEHALDALFRRSSPQLRAFALGLGIRRDRIDDLVHETLVAAVQHGARYDRAQPLMPWLKGILARKAASLVRDEVRRQKHEEAWGAARDQKTSAPPEEAMDREMRELLREAIADSPERYREALELHLLQGLPPAEIAQRQGRLPVTVRVHLHRGMQHVRRRLPRGLFPLAIALCVARDAAAATPLRLARASRIVWWISAAAAIAAATWFIAPVDPSTDSTPPFVASTGDESSRVMLSPPPADGLARTELPAPGRADSGTGSAFVVRLVGSDGAPLAHAGVTIEPSAGEEALPARRRAVTDSIGEASFAGLHWPELRVRSDRGHESVVEVACASLELRCEPSPSLLGCVVDERGVPAADCEVWLADPRHGSACAGVVATTDVDGSFHLDDVVPGSLMAAYGPRGLAPPVAWSGEPEMRIELAPAGSIDGRVVDGDGLPIASAQVAAGSTPEHADEGFPGGVVRLQMPTQILRCDADGRFGPIRLAPGEHAVHARAAGHAPGVAVTRVAAGATSTVVIVLDRARSLRGLVVGADGEPLAGAELVFRDTDRNHRVDLRSDAHGAFRIDVPRTSSGVVCARIDGAKPVRGVVPAFADLTPLQLVLAPAAAKAMRLVFDDGTPVAAWSVRQVTEPRSALDTPERFFTTATDGSFTVTEAGDVRSRFAIRGPGDRVWHALPDDAFSERDGVARAMVPSNFRPSAMLRARCFGRDSAPLAHARVFLRCDDGIAWESARTDATGRFEVYPLAPGEYFVFAESRDPLQPCVQQDGIVVRAHGATDTELHAGPAGTLHWSLRRSDGAVPRAPMVTIVGGRSERRYCARLGARGEQSLPAGEYRLYASGDDFVWVDGAAFRIAPDELTALRLDVDAAVRTPIELRGPGALGEIPCSITLRNASTGRALGSFRLLPDAMPTLTAFLPLGDCELTLAVEGSSQAWTGRVRIDSLAPRHSAFAVELGQW